MGIKLYDGSSWNTQKSLKLYNGSSWSTAVKGWLYNGSAWQISYPEYPVNITAPTVSGSTPIGSTLSVTNGTWNSDDAFSPSSYSYQWKRGGSSISGATSSTYVTTSSDSGQTITCEVSATNQRGSTPVSSSNNIVVNLSTPSGFSSTDLTTNVGSFTVSVTGGQESFSATHTSASNATFYYAGVSNTGSTGSYSPGGIYYSPTTISGTGWGAGTVTVAVYAWNGNKGARISWNAVSGASSYDVSWSGGASGSSSTSNTYYDLYINDLNSSLNITFSVVAKSGSISSSSGSTSVTLNAKLTTAQNTGTITPAPPSAPTGGSVSLLSASSIRASWNSVSNASSYEIYYNFTMVTPPSTADFTGITNTYYDFTGLGQGAVRYIWVRARNSAGASSWTYCGNATTPSAPSAPGTPSVTWTAGTNTYSLSWTAPSSNGGSAIQYYNVEIYKASNSTGTGAAYYDNWNTGSSSTSWSYTPPVTGYFAFQVRAWNGYYWGSFSGRSSPYK